METQNYRKQFSRGQRPHRGKIHSFVRCPFDQQRDQHARFALKLYRLFIIIKRFYSNLHNTVKQYRSVTMSKTASDHHKLWSQCVRASVGLKPVNILCCSSLAGATITTGAVMEYRRRETFLMGFHRLIFFKPILCSHPVVNLWIFSASNRVAAL